MNRFIPLFGEVAGSDNYPGSYFGEIIGHYKSLLDTLMSSIEQLLQGCPVPNQYRWGEFIYAQVLWIR
ncbi:Uncharacterised protein [Raoultella planticola]|uniref:Uncharacterized protein n=1 Tax=Raoultella planticola TaxID=575 RepID=A0A485D4Y4_RAOPL|nr:Uncharacterised protein [Raoultella planticola]